MSGGGSPEVGYAQQEEVVRALSRHYTDGRLEVDAFDDRVRRARAATTPGELAALFTDLPGPHPAITTSGAAAGDAVPTRGGAGDETSTPDAATTGTAAEPPTAGPDDGATGRVDAEATGRFRSPDPTRQYPAAPDASGHPAAGPLPDGSPTTAGPVAGWPPYPHGAAQQPPAPGQYPGDAPHPSGSSVPPGGAAGAYQPGGPSQPGAPYQAGAQYQAGDQSPVGDPYAHGTPYPWAYPPPYTGGSPGAPYPGAPAGVPYPGAPGTGPYAGGHPPHGGPPVPGPYGVYDPSAPFGRELHTGLPYSDKQKVVAGLLQVFLPFGIGRFYSGHAGMAIAQLLVTFLTFGLGGIWSFIDGIVILAGSPLDPQGRPLRP